jgi:[ribosomal protein S5]-alanine N-acetyltransferase
MLELNFKPFPEIETERLLLRRISDEDAPEIFFLRSNKQVLHYINKEPAASIDAAREFISNINSFIDKSESILWGIAWKDQPAKVIGTICFWNIRTDHYRAEIGYALHPDQWKKGVMKEAIKATLDHGFNRMGLHSVDAHINPENLASSAVLEANGFRKEAHFREDLCYKGEFFDTIIYAKLASDPV